jgi:hypothetical protein
VARSAADPDSVDLPEGPPRRYLFYVEQNYCYGILRPIQNVLRHRGDDVAWLPVGSDFDRSGFEPGERVFDHVREAIAWRPCAVMVPGNFVPDFIPGVKVMVTHGLLSEKRRKKDGMIYSFIERGLFDLYITHGPNTTERWRQMAREAGYFEVAECGWSKLDPLFDGSLSRTPSDLPVVYFASTFSPRLTAAPRLVDTVADLLARRDWRWLVHFHPKMPAAVTDRYRAIRSDRLQVVEGHDTLQLLLDADVLLCDTSSIISEFALLQKPVVTYRNLAPKPYMIDVRQPEQVGLALERALQRPEAVMHAIAEHARETHPWNDGRCSERIVAATDRLLQSGLGHLRRKPRNRIRHWKMRKTLRYYRLF